MFNLSIFRRKKQLIKEIELLRGELAEEKKNHQLTWLHTRDCVIQACTQVEMFLHTDKPDPATVLIQVDINPETLKVILTRKRSKLAGIRIGLKLG